MSDRLALPSVAASNSSGIYSSHGIWAPGVHVMRNMNFAKKTLIICLIFLIPILISSGIVLVDKRAVIASGQQELNG